MTAEEIKQRWDELRSRIDAAATRAGRDGSTVRVVAVTKTHPVEAIRAAIEAGIQDIGENKVQEAVPKIEALSKGAARFHLIGHLQTNKSKVAVANFDLIHSVDSLRLAREINRHAASLGKKQEILLQVNVSGEFSKSGYEADALRSELRQLLETCPSVVVRGFMTMAPLLENPEDARPHFRNLRLLAEELTREWRDFANFRPGELSMGMTGDFEAAVEEGATLVRIGSALFGNR